MTATLPPPAAAAGTGLQPGGRAAAHRSPRRVGRARRVLLHTPGKLWALGAALVLLSLAWGAIGGLVATQHSSAADSVASGNEQLTLDSRHLYQSIADADATITAAFLANPTPSLQQLQHFELDLTTAHQDLSGLQAAIGNDPVVGTDLASLGSGLSAYSGYIGEATSEYAMGYPLTGGTFLTVASEEAHLTLLPAANAVFTQENAELGAANGQATGLPTMIGLLVLAVVAALLLYRAQRWLTRRTNRVFSPGLVFASAALFASVIWVLVSFLGARSDLDSGISHGSGPAQNLALASIGVQQVRGDSVLNVISRSGSSSFADDFSKTSKQIDGWLGAAAAAQQNTSDSDLVSTAQRHATAWYTANHQVYIAGTKSDYAQERELVIGSGTGSTASGYDVLEEDFTQAIAADQAVFTSAAAHGASALDPLTDVLAAASAAMALGCGWAISRRLAEYR
jgi:hypothetical protein